MTHFLVVLSAIHKVEYKPEILTHYKFIIHTRGNEDTAKGKTKPQRGKLMLS